MEKYVLKYVKGIVQRHTNEDDESVYPVAVAAFRPELSPLIADRSMRVPLTHIWRTGSAFESPGASAPA